MPNTKYVGSYDYQLNENARYQDGMVLTFSDKYLSHIQGRILTLLEALNVQGNFKAIKSLVNDAIWGDMHNGWAVPADEEEWVSLCSVGMRVDTYEPKTNNSVVDTGNPLATSEWTA